MSASEREFIFDAVIGYLTSPIWNFPVRTFIEHNSLGMLQFPHSFWEFYSLGFLLILLIVNLAKCSHFVFFEYIYYDFFFECFDSF